jgi:hypothetical protein
VSSLKGVSVSARNSACRWVLIVHFVAAWVFAIPMLFFVGKAAEWVNWYPFDPTMVKLMGAALLALGVGSLLATRDPYHHRLMVQTEIVFTFVGALTMLYRLVWADAWTPHFAWAVFGVLTAFFVAFSLAYPKAEP